MLMKKGNLGTKHGWESQDLSASIEKHFDRVKNGNPLIGPHKPGPDSINLMSNDYLNLGSDHQIITEMVNTLLRSSHSPIMSAVYLNEDSAQARLEKEFSSFTGYEDAMICQSGFAANDGLLQCVARFGEKVYMDKFAHHSFMQGCISAKIEPIIFKHNNLKDLKELIEKNGPGLVLVDSVYSSVGSICPLKQVVELCHETGCGVVVDESHSLGIFGPQGEGMVANLGLTEEVDFVTASLSKAFAGRAGIILGSSRHLEFIRYNSSPAIFSSGLLPYEISGLEKTLEIIKGASDRRATLFKNGDKIRNALKDLGYNIGYSQAYIISLLTGPEAHVIILRDALEKRGLYGAVFCAPASPKNSTMVRLTVNSAITEEQIDRIIQICSEAKSEFDQLTKIP